MRPMVIRKVTQREQQLSCSAAICGGRKNIETRKTVLFVCFDAVVLGCVYVCVFLFLGLEGELGRVHTRKVATF